MSTLQQHLERLVLAAEQGHWSDAAILSEELLKRAPNALSVLEVYASALAHLGRTVDAIDVYQRALSLGLAPKDKAR